MKSDHLIIKTHQVCPLKMNSHDQFLTLLIIFLILLPPDYLVQLLFRWKRQGKGNGEWNLN